jgi:protein phosphatase
VFTLSQKDEALNGMGTTVVAAIVCETQAVICNVGDSRAYLINDNLRQITRDHSIVQTLVESGKLSPEEARVHPEKNVITRALGVEENILTDSYVIDINENDMLLLCTDGLSNYADSESILRIVKDNALDKTTALLIDKANAGGGRDNITAAVISH